MIIRVFVDSISDSMYEEIINYYNENKPADEEPLARLNRCEGGFKIEIPEKQNEPDENNKIRQLRWSNKCLKAEYPLIGFTEKQEYLLYEALVNVLRSAELGH
jgi:hypothetical protein